MDRIARALLVSTAIAGVVLSPHAAEAKLKKIKIGGDVGRAWERTKKNVPAVGRAINKVAIHAGKELKRGGENIEEGVHAAGKYIERQAHGVGQTFEDAGKRLSEGKIIDAAWHFATDPYKHTERNLAKAAQESSLIRTVGQVGATVYFGPQGAGAYSAWLTYRSTGSFEKALKSGAISYGTAYAFDHIAKSDAGIGTKIIGSGTVAAAGVIVSGGDERAARDAFLIGAASAAARGHYKVSTKGELDARASEGDAMPADAKKDMTKLTASERHRPHVGKHSTMIDVGKGKDTWANKYVVGERSPVMQGVSKIPGMNATAVFHDHWVKVTGMDQIQVLNVGSIPPAIVFTYMATGAPIDEQARKTARSWEQRQSSEVGAKAAPASG